MSRPRRWTAIARLAFLDLLFTEATEAGATPHHGQATTRASPPRFDQRDAARRDRHLPSRERQPMIVLRLALQSLRNRWVTALAHGVGDRGQHHRCCWASRRSAPARAPELRRHHLRHRSDRRRRSGSINLLLYSGVPHRQRHQQRHLAELPGTSPARPEIDWVVPAVARATATTAFACSARRPTTSRTTSYRQTHGLAVLARGSRSPTSSMPWSAPMSRRRLGLQRWATPSSSRMDWARSRSSSTTTSRFAFPGILEKTGTPVDRTVHVGPGGDRGHPRRLAKRSARSPANRSRPTKCAGWISSRKRSRPPRWSVSSRSLATLQAATANQRISELSRYRRSCRGPRCRSCGAGRHRPRRP